MVQLFPCFLNFNDMRQYLPMLYWRPLLAYSKITNLQTLDNTRFLHTTPCAPVLLNTHRLQTSSVHSIYTPFFLAPALIKRRVLGPTTADGPSGLPVWLTRIDAGMLLIATPEPQEMVSVSSSQWTRHFISLSFSSRMCQGRHSLHTSPRLGTHTRTHTQKAIQTCVSVRQIGCCGR